MAVSHDSFVVGGDFCVCGDELTNTLENERLSPFAHVREIFGNKAALIANLECSLTDANNGRPYKWANLKASPRLHWTLDELAMAVIGNNHITDFGAQGVRDTKALLARKSIEAPGYGSSLSDALRPAYLKIDNHTLGVVSLCCPTTNGENLATHLTAGVAPLGMQTLKNAIEAARPSCDALVVYLHWGCERVHDPAPDQLRLARLAIDSGADAVVGCHSHTIQSYENYLGRWIFYGLGNYLFGRSMRQRIRADGSALAVPSVLQASNRESLAVEFAIAPSSENGRLVLRRIQPMRFEDDQIPYPINFDQLTFDLEKCNRNLRRYTSRTGSTLRNRAEPVFRTELRNGILAHWYAVESINMPPTHSLLGAVRQTLKRLRRAFSLIGDSRYLKAE